MRSFSRFMVWMLVMASMGSAAHAQVVLNMPPPRSSQPQTVLDTSPGPVNKTPGNAQAQTPVPPADPARVGKVALARYAQARARPRSGYGYRGRYGRPYGYYDPYYYGYYPFHFGFGHFSFGHHFHHHHEMGMAGGGD